MNRNFTSLFAFLFIVFGCIFWQFGCVGKDNSEAGEEPLTEFGRLLADRPAPDLQRLAERSSPEYTGEDTAEAFYDILKLRDIPDVNAIPVLEEILSQDNYKGRIHGYAAAQALFCIDAPEAHQVLSKYLLTPNYYALSGINYTFSWEMDKSKRDNFIEQYHLKNISKDMEVKVGLEKNKTTSGQKLDFKVTLKNISQKSYRIRDKQVYLGQMLFFRSQSGRFLQWCQPVDYEMPMPKWIELAPGESREYNISMDIRHKGTQKLPYFGKDEDVTIMLETFDMICGIEKPGKYKVYAMVEEQPLTKAHLEQLDFDNPWPGRAVSEPIVVEIDVK
ncbi:MAG: hypothetical protein JW715_15320 [Sedimentisphaerales bacterium]|nr:hypothetical protein [Sedimentisphaerales bacterium]